MLHLLPKEERISVYLTIRSLENLKEFKIGMVKNTGLG